jgi:hypothetical protein
MTQDSREYPPHLQAYHVYDAELLPLVERLQPATFDELSVQVEDRATRAVIQSWLASARWRGLVEIDEPTNGAVRRYVAGRHDVSSAA